MITVLAELAAQAIITDDLANRARHEKPPLLGLLGQATLRLVSVTPYVTSLWAEAVLRRYPEAARHQANADSAWLAGERRDSEVLEESILADATPAGEQAAGQKAMTT